MKIDPKRFGASKQRSTLLVLFIPSHDRSGQPIDQDFWVNKALEVLGTLLGGATAFPQGKGVWKDTALGGQLKFDALVIIQSYTSEADIEANAKAMRKFLITLGTGARQGAVGFVIDQEYLEIEFPLPKE